MPGLRLASGVPLADVKVKADRDWIRPQETGSAKLAGTEDHNGTANLPWQGCVSWSWRKTANTRGPFRGSFVPAATYSAGTKWLNTGHGGLDSLQALQGQLSFGSVFPYSTALTEALEDAWSGNILLLCCQQPPPPCSTHMDTNLSSPSLLLEDGPPTAALISCLCGRLQHCRLTGCLQANSAALMAQGPSQLRMGKTAKPAKEVLHSCGLPSQPSFTSGLSSGKNSCASVEAESRNFPPAINVLLVHVEHLQQWLPPNALDQQQHADIAAQAAVQQTSICALLMMQKIKSAERQPVDCCMQQMQPLPAPLPQPRAVSVQGSSHQPSDDIDQNKQSTAELQANMQAQDQAVLPVPTKKLQLPKRPRLEQLNAASAETHSKRCKLQQDMPALQLPEQQYPEASSIQHDEIIVSILVGIKQLGLLHSSKHTKQALSVPQLDQLKAQPVLSQLRFLALFATSYNPSLSVSQHFSNTMAAFQQKPCNTSWLLHRCGPPAKRRLCAEAQDLYDQLSSYTAWPCNACPDLVAQLFPVELQPAYILCLAGYAGPRPLTHIAADVMDCILQKAHQAAQNSPRAQLAQRVMRKSLEQAAQNSLTAQQVPRVTEDSNQQTETCVTPQAAKAALGGRLDSAVQPLQQISPPSSSPVSDSSSVESPESRKPSRSKKQAAAIDDGFDTRRALRSVERALIKLDLLSKHFSGRAVGSLWLQPPLTQLIILSGFCARHDPRRSQYCYLEELCGGRVTKNLINECLLEFAPCSIGRSARSLIAEAWTRGVFESRYHKHEVEAAVLVLPERLQCVTACLAIGTFMISDDDEQALRKVKHCVDTIQALFQQAQLALRSR